MAPSSRAPAAVEIAGLSPEALRILVRRALEEDLGAGDLTSRLTIPEAARGRGRFFAKQALVVAGLPVAEEVFRALDETVAWQPRVAEGAEVAAKAALAVATGPARALLAGERVALNFLQHLSGIATLTRALRRRLEGLPTELLDTRKTIPGLRALEKYAVRMGGGRNHRFGLYDGILIKNNHLRLAGGVRGAVERAIAGRPAGVAVEVEARTLEELDEALAAGAEWVLLDNMTPEEVRAAVARARGRAKLEVSGGVTAENIRAYAETGVDAISVGALTHSAPAADIHFLIEPL